MYRQTHTWSPLCFVRFSAYQPTIRPHLYVCVYACPYIQPRWGKRADIHICSIITSAGTVYRGGDGEGGGGENPDRWRKGREEKNEYDMEEKQKDRQRGRKRKKHWEIHKKAHPISLYKWKGFMTQNPTVWMSIWEDQLEKGRKMRRKNEQQGMDRKKGWERRSFSSMEATFQNYKSTKNKPIKSFYYCLSAMSVC